MTKRVRVITPITTRDFRGPHDFDALQSADVRIEIAEIDTGPASIECELDEALAIPGTVARIIEAEQDGVDAVVIDCMGDPGMRPARECVAIPVVGPAETAMHIAAILGHSFSIITVLDNIRPMIENQAAIYGLRSKLASVRSVNIPVLDLEADVVRVKRVLTEQAVHAVEEDGADAIIFGCTGMLGCAEAVQAGLKRHGLDVPVIDPVPAAVRFAIALIDSGLRHSKRTYRPPPRKPIVGYQDVGSFMRDTAA